MSSNNCACEHLAFDEALRTHLMREVQGRVLPAFHSDSCCTNDAVRRELRDGMALSQAWENNKDPVGMMGLISVQSTGWGSPGHRKLTLLIAQLLSEYTSEPSLSQEDRELAVNFIPYLTAYYVDGDTLNLKEILQDYEWSEEYALFSDDVGLFDGKICNPSDSSPTLDAIIEAANLIIRSAAQKCCHWFCQEFLDCLIDIANHSGDPRNTREALCQLIRMYIPRAGITFSFSL